MLAKIAAYSAYGNTDGLRMRTRMQFCTLGALTLQIELHGGESTEMSLQETMRGVIHTSIVGVYEFRRGFCTSVLFIVVVIVHQPSACCIIYYNNFSWN